MPGQRLFDLIDPAEILRERKANRFKAFEGLKGDDKGFAIAGSLVGNFLRGQTDKAGFTDPLEDPELDKARGNFEILGEIQNDPTINLEDPDTLRGLAQRFRQNGSLQQSAKLIQRAKEFEEGSAQAERSRIKDERETSKFNQGIRKGELDIEAKEASNLFSSLTKDSRIKKALNDAGISEQRLGRLIFENRRLAEGLPAQPSAASDKPPKETKIDKTFDVGVDAVIERKLAEAGKNESLKELDDDDPISRTRNQIRSRAKQIKDDNKALSTEEAAERAFDDLLKLEESSFFGLFGGDFKRNKDVPKVGERRRIKFQP